MKIKMIGKLFFALSIAIASISCAQANWEKYVETVATGKEGVQQACFVRSTLSDAVDRYAGETIVEELYDDYYKSKEYLADKLVKFNLRSCFKFDKCENIGRFSTEREFTGEKFVDAQCFISLKFEVLCKLIKERNPIDRQMLAAENWVCQVKDELKMRRDARYGCKQTVWEEARQQAKMEFYGIMLFNDQELERAKQAFNEKLAIEKELKSIHEAEIAEEAHQLIRERIAKHFADYQTCWAKIEAEEERETREAKEKAEVEAAKQAEPAKKKKGYFRRMLERVGR